MFVTKYRHPVLTGKVKDVVYERIHYVADQRGFHILDKKKGVLKVAKNNAETLITGMLSSVNGDYKIKIEWK